MSSLPFRVNIIHKYHDLDMKLKYVAIYIEYLKVKGLLSKINNFKISDILEFPRFRQQVYQLNLQYQVSQ